MTHDPADTPAAHLQHLGESVERDPVYRARQERVGRVSGRRPLNPWRNVPAIGLSLVVLLLLARWLAGLIGLA